MSTAKRAKEPARAWTRLQALGEILAAEAAQVPAVEDFRRDNLKGGRLLSWPEAIRWIHRREHGKGRAGILLFHEPGGKKVLGVRAPRGRTLDQLRQMSETLAHEYGWRPARATIFVLTGQTPELPAASVSLHRRERFPMASTITLRVRPDMTEAGVGWWYSRLRARAVGLRRRHSTLDPKRAELAVFAARHNNGRRWREVLALWNAAHPQRRVDSVQLFARDCAQAYERVTGARLEWKGGGRRPRKPRFMQSLEEQRRQFEETVALVGHEAVPVTVEIQPLPREGEKP